jgi:integrase
VKSQFLIDKQELHPGLIIFRRGDVKHHNWYCRIKIPKEDRYKTISLETADINEAKKKATRHSYDIETRIEHQIPVFEKTFAEVAQEYHDFQKLLAQAKEITMNRWKIVGSYIRLHLVPYMGNKQIEHVGKTEWGTYPLWRKNEGGNVIVKKAKSGTPEEKTIVPAKDGAIRQEMMTLRAIMNFAADKQYIRERQVPTGNLPSGTARREEFTPQEYRHLHTFARGWIKEATTQTSLWYRNMAYNFMLVMTNTGMRPPEARNLRWRDFDVRTDKQGRRFVCLDVRGKGKYRQLVASESVATYFERIRELAINRPNDSSTQTAQGKKTISPDDFIFINATGASSSRLYGFLITDLLKKSKLLFSSSGSRRSTYCFRHTYATFRLIEGVDFIYLAPQMGTSVKMLEDHYAHIAPSKHAGRILQGAPGWEHVADAGEISASVNAGGAGKKAAKPRTKK